MVGMVHYRLSTRAARVTRANINLCLPELAGEDLELLVKQSLIETGKTMLETPAVWMNDMDGLEGWMTTCNESILTNALASPRGVLILLPHIGNWELFNIYFRRHGKMTALYQPPKKTSLHELMAEIRSRHGNEMVATDAAGLRKLYRSLKAGGTTVVLPDQVPESGRYIPFFGQLALTDELSARLLLKTGAIAIGASVIRLTDGRFEVRFFEPGETLDLEDIESLMLKVNQMVETIARENLAQYQWEYKRFRERPAGLHKVYRFDRPTSFHR